MFKNAGEKIMDLARFVFVLHIIIFAIAGFIYGHTLFGYGVDILLGSISAAIGCFIGFINSIVLYAFGELCTNVKSIKETITDEEE